MLVEKGNAVNKRVSSAKSKVKRDRNLPRDKNGNLCGRKASMGTGCTTSGSHCRCGLGSSFIRCARRAKGLRVERELAYNIKII